MFPACIGEEEKRVCTYHRGDPRSLDFQPTEFLPINISEIRMSLDLVRISKTATRVALKELINKEGKSKSIKWSWITVPQ